MRPCSTGLHRACTPSQVASASPLLRQFLFGTSVASHTLQVTLPSLQGLEVLCFVNVQLATICALLSDGSPDSSRLATC